MKKEERKECIGEIVWLVIRKKITYRLNITYYTFYVSFYSKKQIERLFKET